MLPGLVLTARVPPSGLTLAPPRVGDDGRAGGWDVPFSSLGGFTAGHKLVCSREARKWAARSLCPWAQSSLLACQLLALPHSNWDTHPEGQPCAKTHALPTVTSAPSHGPLAHCKATTGAVTLLAQASVWPRVCMGQDTPLSTQGSVPVQHAPAPSSYCHATTLV